MGRVVSRVAILAVFTAIVWLAGNRYGVPDFVMRLTDPVFDFIEVQTGKLWQKGTSSFDEAAPDEPDGTEADDDTDDDAGSSAPVSIGGIPANADLRINEAGLDIIRESESLQLSAYQHGGITYIGYGHRLEPGDPRTITETEADRLLREDVRVAEEAVRNRLTRPATENQFSAMVSLTFNLGSGNFSRSPVLANFNKGDIQGAADAFLTHNRGGGEVLDHLTQRRQKERALFLS